ncbi:MAG: iron ABC transporter permease, partial [Bilophila wadsworthia]
TFVVANYIANFLMVGGAGSLDKVVGMTFDGWEETRYGEYVVYTETFPKLKAIPSIGGYHDNILDSEKILSLRPDVLLVGRSQFADNNQKIDIFEKAGIKVVVLDYIPWWKPHEEYDDPRPASRQEAGPEQCDVRLSA